MIRGRGFRMARRSEVGYTGDAEDGALYRSPDAAELGVVARVPNTATLPNGEQAAILQAEHRGRVVATHRSERGADHAEVELLAEPRPTPRVEAAARELRVVLARLRSPALG